MKSKCTKQLTLDSDPQLQFEESPPARLPSRANSRDGTEQWMLIRQCAADAVLTLQAVRRAPWMSAVLLEARRSASPNAIYVNTWDVSRSKVYDRTSNIRGCGDVEARAGSGYRR